LFTEAGIRGTSGAREYRMAPVSRSTTRAPEALEALFIWRSSRRMVASGPAA
jgi:hypothetical protein